MRKSKRIICTRLSRFRPWHLSLFEQVILVNSVLLIGEALAALWVTSHNLEAHHYLIDTAFIVGATVFTLFANLFLLRLSFRPLFGLLATIRQVSAGKTEARATSNDPATETGELALAFNAMLDRLETLYREQAALILQAQEEERRRIALELHDETGQNLTALLVHLELLSQALQALPDPSLTAEARKQLEQGFRQLTSLTQQTLENIHVLASQLRPSVLDDLGLLAALRWLGEESAQRLHLRVDLTVEEQWPSHLPPAYETALFRIAQESLTNIARHAHAQKVSLFLSSDQHGLRLSISDDGRGYDPTQPKTGLGIFGMRERASLLGGTLAIQSTPRKGTALLATFPLPAGSRVVSRKDSSHVC